MKGIEAATTGVLGWATSCFLLAPDWLRLHVYCKCIQNTGFNGPYFVNRIRKFLFQYLSKYAAAYKIWFKLNP